MTVVYAQIINRGSMDMDNVVSVNRDIDTVLNDVDQEIYSEDWNDYSRRRIKDEIRQRGVAYIGSEHSREIRFKETTV
jgi:hypothetical protein